MSGNYLEILKKLQNPDVVLKLLGENPKNWNEFLVATRDLEKLRQCIQNASSLRNINWLNVTVINSTLQNARKNILKTWYLY